MNEETSVLRFCRRVAGEALASLHPGKRKANVLWRTKVGVDFVRDIGIQPGDSVIDFGAGPGNYSIPAARQVGAAGRVYSVEKRNYMLKRLVRDARAAKLNHIHGVAAAENVSGILGGTRCRAVLFYDVLQFMELEERMNLYRLADAWTVPDGFLSVHPKHTMEDSPDRHFRGMSLDSVCREIESAGYCMEKRMTTTLWHGHGMMQGTIWNFKKCARDGNVVAGKQNC